MNKIEIDHVDIVTSHICNNNCKFCIDKFIHTSKDIISLEDIEKFLKLLKLNTDKKLTVLLLGGEPTVLPIEKLIDIADLVHNEGFRITMSTNGKLRNKIVQLIPYFDSIQITVNSDEEIDFYRTWSHKINIKLAGDSTLTLEKLNHFIEYTKGFDRRSISMYFTPDFVELCSDKKIWNLLNELTWKRNGSYMYAFYNGVRIKKCIPGETNIIDEPTVPKLYPNGNYNKTWNDEELDDYLSIDGLSWHEFNLESEKCLKKQCMEEIMENKNLQLIDLTVEELIYLSSFAKTIRHYGIDGSIYHYGTYGEQKVCITKSDVNVWEVYIGERGKIFDKASFESCFDACIELLKYGTDTKAVFMELMNYYEKEVEAMKNSLKQLEEKESVPQITNSLLQLKKTKK